MKNCIINLSVRVKNALDDFFRDEKGEVNIVAIVVLIGIAVILAVAFKDQIKKLLDKLFGDISNSASKAINDKP